MLFLVQRQSMYYLTSFERLIETWLCYSVALWMLRNIFTMSRTNIDCEIHNPKCTSFEKV